MTPQLFPINAVIPTSNSGKYQADAVQGIRPPNHPADEIIVFDGGSTENTLENAGVANETQRCGTKSELWDKVSADDPIARLLPSSLLYALGYRKQHLLSPGDLN